MAASRCQVTNPEKKKRKTRKIERNSSPRLVTQRMQDELLVTLHGCFEVGHREVLVVAMCHQNTPRTVKVTGVVALEVRNISAIVHDSHFKSCVEPGGLVSRGPILFVHFIFFSSRKGSQGRGLVWAALAVGGTLPSTSQLASTTP